MLNLFSHTSTYLLQESLANAS